MKISFRRITGIEKHIGIMINNVEKQVLLKKYMTEQAVVVTENLQKWRQNHGRLQNKGSGVGKKAE